MSGTDPVSPPGDPAPALLDGRLWVDGCFDFFHHGHAGAIVQARQLGDELFVGVHSDEAILENKGPTVMSLAERLAAVDACRWATASVARAPYVTQLDWISHYGCRYVVHGDDITSDGDGEDCYRFVKAAGRFKVVKRTPSISTTDLVGRMLLCTKTHFVRSLEAVLEGGEGPGTDAEKKERGAGMKERMRLYATDETARAPGADVWFWSASREAKTEDTAEEKGVFRDLFRGKGVRPGQRVVYVDGGFDLFSSGHIEFLRLVVEEEERLARAEGWYAQQAVDERKGKGEDYGPVYVVAGVHDDHVINQWKGVNYPVMNIYERGLCVLQCKVSCSATANRAHDSNMDAVRQCGRLWRPVLPDQGLPYLAPLGHSRRRLSRPDVLHAPHVRPLHGTQGDGHLPRGWRTQVQGRQCGHHRAAHHEEQGHVRGAAESQGYEGRRGSSS